MRAFRRSRSARKRRPVRIPGAVLLLVGCLPGFAAVAALVMGASSAERPVVVHSPQPIGARSAALHAAPRPRIVRRSVWANAGAADGSPATQPPPRYDDKVVAVFVHHTASPNTYDCSDTPRIIRALYAGQIGNRRWDDIGYNFLVDRCGTIYEGRSGGIDRPVTGAHTQGFNHRTAGIAAIGTFSQGVSVPRAMTDAIAALAAWKLGLADIDPRSKVRLVSSNGQSRYKEGTTALLPALAGHNDGYMTDCPGAALTALLPAIREKAAHLQGRS